MSAPGICALSMFQRSKFRLDLFGGAIAEDHLRAFDGSSAHPSEVCGFIGGKWIN